MNHEPPFCVFESRCLEFKLTLWQCCVSFACVFVSAGFPSFSFSVSFHPKPYFPLLRRLILPFIFGRSCLRLSGVVPRRLRWYVIRYFYGWFICRFAKLLFVQKEVWNQRPKFLIAHRQRSIRGLNKGLTESRMYSIWCNRWHTPCRTQALLRSIRPCIAPYLSMHECNLVTALILKMFIFKMIKRTWTVQVVVFHVFCTILFIHRSQASMQPSMFMNSFLFLISIPLFGKFTRTASSRVAVCMLILWLGSDFMIHAHSVWCLERLRASLR